MKSLVAAVVIVGFVSALLVHRKVSGVTRQQSALGTEGRERELIRMLKLSMLPKESGYLGIIGVSAQKVKVDGRELAVQSQNYYMLTRGRPVNYLHPLVAGDSHLLVEGWPGGSFNFCPAWRAAEVTFGIDTG